MDFVRGILTEENGTAFLKGEKEHFKGERIWDGYKKHWMGRPLRGRTLPQRDYETGRPIVILWPDEEISPKPHLDLYYNEKLTHYWESAMGHIAASVNGEIFNFSNALNENEIITPEEYFYRPALGEFAPDPVRGKINTGDPEKPYFDKFGRLFMRSIHVLRFHGVDLASIRASLEESLKLVHSSPVNPARPELYAQFSVFKRSCTTFTRDALRKGGLKVSGILPRDFFVNAAVFAKHSGLEHRMFVLQQLKVDEAPHSAPSRLMNPANWLKQRKLSAPS